MQVEKPGRLKQFIPDLYHFTRVDVRPWMWFHVSGIIKALQWQEKKLAYFGYKNAVGKHVHTCKYNNPQNMSCTYKTLFSYRRKSWSSPATLKVLVRAPVHVWRWILLGVWHGNHSMGGQCLHACLSREAATNKADASYATKPTRQYSGSWCALLLSGIKDSAANAINKLGRWCGGGVGVCVSAYVCICVSVC